MSTLTSSVYKIKARAMHVENLSTDGNHKQKYNVRSNLSPIRGIEPRATA